MQKLNLVLAVPQGSIIATSLGIDGLAWHRSPGSGKYFQSRSILIDLAITPEGRPAFKFLGEGDWRDADADASAALSAVASGKRTKTALSNNAFSCTPIAAYQGMYLTKTGGEMLEMKQSIPLAEYRQSVCHEGMTPNEIAEGLGLPQPTKRVPRLYMVFSPAEFIVLSSLTPQEYVWYATHRPGKKFRQVLFTELRADHAHLAAESVYDMARDELQQNVSKKTKTIVTGECINRIPFQAWAGYHHETTGGIYVGDQNGIGVWNFPDEIPWSWERADK